MEEVAKYVLNPDENIVARVKAKVASNESECGKGYCPCVIKSKRTDDTVCPCLEYRTTGKCRCGLYVE